MPKILSFLLVLLNLLCFSLFMQGVTCRVDENDFASIYASTYDRKWDSSDPFEMFNIIRISSKNDVFIAASKNGIIVIRDNEIIYSKAEEEPIQNLFITSDGEYLFVNLNNRLCVLNFLEVTPNVFAFKRVYEEIHLSEDVGAVVDVTFDKTESRALVSHQHGTLLLYDISERASNKFSLLDSFNTDIILTISKISQDLKWIVIADYQIGFLYYRWLDDNESAVDSPIIKNKLNIYMVAISVALLETNFYITNDSRYVITLDFYVGISVFDLKPLLDVFSSNSVKPDPFEVIEIFPVLKRWWPTAKGQSSSMALAVSADEKFAAMGERSVAIYLVDIRDVLNPKLYQKIKATSFSYSVAFSKDANEEFLYYSNGISLQRFKKQQPNLNIDIPNLYNVHRSMNNVVGNTVWRYHGSTDKQGQFYFLTAQDDGFYIMDLRKSVVLMEDCVHFEAGELSFTDNFVLFGGSEQRFLAFPRVNYTMNTMLDIFDISDRTKPSLIAQIGVEKISYSGAIDVFEARDLLIFDNLHQIVLVNISSLPNSFEINSIFDFESGQYKPVNCIRISSNGSYVLLLARSKGLYIINIDDLTKPVKEGFEVFLGSESLVNGKYAYTSYMFLADGLQGIKVIDQTAFPLIKIIKVIEIRGFAIGLALLKHDRFALVNSLDLGQISLIDFSDISSAAVVSTFQFKEEDSVTVSLLNNEDYFYLVNYKGVRVVPLYSDTYIHTDIKQVLDSQTGTPTLQAMSRDTVFQVGQIIDLTFIILRPVNGISITGIFYLLYYDVVDIPYWMTFNSKDSMLELKIVKDSLGSDYSSSDARIQQNTIVVQTKRPVLVSDFVFNYESNGVDCSIEEAKLIWEYFKNNGLLDKQAYVTNLFEYENALTFEIAGVPSSDKLRLLVKMALQESIMFNPIIFSVKASLSMQVLPTVQQESLSSSSSNSYLKFIETISEYVYLYLTINKQLGKFVIKSYPGVILSMSDTSDQMKLEGDPININKVLTQKVQLFLSNSTDAAILEGIINVRLTDSINYEVSQSHSLNSVGFLKFLPQIAQNPEMRLQDQVDRKFSGQSFDIKTNIDLQFASNSFLADSDSSLTYSARIVQYKVNSQVIEYKDIEKDFWFQFSASSFKFAGTTTFSDYNNEICIQVNATDSYSWVTDEFCMNPSGIPLVVVLNLIIQYIGPILFLIGLYKYKDRIYNITYSSRNFYMRQELKVGEQFEMPTIFIGQYMEIARAIFIRFLENYQNNCEKKVTLTNQIKKVFRVFLKAFKRLFRSLFLNTKSDQLIYDRIHSLIVQSAQPTVLPKNVATLSELYIDKNDKSIMTHKFLQDIVSLEDFKLTINQVNFDFSAIKPELLIESNILRICLLNELTRHLLKHDALSKYIHSLAKLADYKKDNTSKKDRFYYRKYTIVNHSNQIETYNSYFERFKQSFTMQHSLIAYYGGFSRITINEDLMNSFFATFESKLNIIDNEQGGQKEGDVNFFISNNSKSNNNNNNNNNNNKNISLDSIGRTMKLSNYWINKQLIKQIIVFDALGLDPKQVSTFTPCVGESLHLHDHEITSVQAFQKPESKKQFALLRRWLNLEYFPLASHENRKIPHWLNFHLKRNMLLLEGRPGEGEEDNEYLIRFYDQRKFIVKQFIINIVNESKKKVFSMDKLDEQRLLSTVHEREILQQRKGMQYSNSCTQLNYQNNNDSMDRSAPDESASIYQLCFPTSQLQSPFHGKSS